MEIHQKKKKIDLKEQKEQKEKEKVHLFKKRVFQSKYIKKRTKSFCGGTTSTSYIGPGNPNLSKTSRKTPLGGNNWMPISNTTQMSRKIKLMLLWQSRFKQTRLHKAYKRISQRSDSLLQQTKSASVVRLDSML